MQQHCGEQLPHSGHIYHANGTVYFCPGTG